MAHCSTLGGVFATTAAVKSFVTVEAAGSLVNVVSKNVGVCQSFQWHTLSKRLFVGRVNLGPFVRRS